MCQPIPLHQVVERGAATLVSLRLPGLSAELSEALLVAGVELSDQTAQKALADIHAMPRHGITYALAAHRQRKLYMRAFSVRQDLPCVVPRVISAARTSSQARVVNSYVSRPRNIATTYANGLIRPMVRRLRDFHIFLHQMAEEQQVI